MLFTKSLTLLLKRHKIKNKLIKENLGIKEKDFR